jgi:hypothetical protein
MQWLANTFTGLVSEYPEGTHLQRTGVISREHLLQFFERGLQMFDSPEVKEQLKVAHATRKDVPDLVTNLQMRIFEELGIQGSFAIAFLSRVQQVYQADQEVIARFFNFVSREEMACDEAELSEQEFQQKYATALAFQEEMQKKSAEMESMTPEQRQAFMQKMLQQSSHLQASGCSTCTSGCSCEAPPTNQAMTADEQMAFFQSLSSRPS